MPQPEPTEIRINEHGDESHESWITIRANLVSGRTRLFDSEITHQHYVSVIVQRCTRKRDLHRDWIHNTKTLMEIGMSQAQWGAFVSSFGNGSGVPATLNWFNGPVPRMAEVDSRLEKSHKEVRGAAAKGMAKVRAAQLAVQEAFDQKLGIKETRKRLAALDTAIQHMPLNMEFAAASMTEHVEETITKARADVEAMVHHALKNGTAIEGGIDLLLQLTESGDSNA